MPIPITQLRGMTTDLEGDLHMQGIYHTEQLLATTGTPAAREALANALGVEAQIVLALANRADLSRIWGVAGVFSDLLEQAGVDTVRELAGRNPDNLYAKLGEVNARRKLARRLPSRQAVREWIAQARALPRCLEY